MENELVKPNINLNGSDGMELARQYYEAAQAVENAANLMGRLVHGRDYQGSPDGAYERAYEQMVERLKPMISAYNDLKAIAEHCVEEA